MQQAQNSYTIQLIQQMTQKLQLISSDKLIQMFKLSDTNRDNQLDHKEFESLIQSLLPETDQMKINLLFEELDTNKEQDFYE